MATGTYADVTGAYTALVDNVEVEFNRLDLKDDITPDEEAYLEQLVAARKLLDVLDLLLFRAPEV